MLLFCIFLIMNVVIIDKSNPMIIAISPRSNPRRKEQAAIILICDLDDVFIAEESKRQRLHRKGDSAVLKHLIQGYKYMKFENYIDAVSKKCRAYINGIKTKSKALIDLDIALQCAIALGKRKFVFEVLLDRIEINTVKGRD